MSYTSFSDSFCFFWPFLNMVFGLLSVAEVVGQRYHFVLGLASFHIQKR